MTEDDKLILDVRRAVDALDDGQRERLVFALTPKTRLMRFLNGWAGTSFKGRTCMVCGAKFDARSANQSYCSKKCREIGHRNTQKMTRAKAADSAFKAVLALPDDVRARLIDMFREEKGGK